MPLTQAGALQDGLPALGPRPALPERCYRRTRAHTLALALTPVSRRVHGSAFRCKSPRRTYDGLRYAVADSGAGPCRAGVCRGWFALAGASRLARNGTRDVPLPRPMHLAGARVRQPLDAARRDQSRGTRHGAVVRGGKGLRGEADSVRGQAHGRLLLVAHGNHGLLRAQHCLEERAGRCAGRTGGKLPAARAQAWGVHLPGGRSVGRGHRQRRQDR